MGELPESPRTFDDLTSKQQEQLIALLDKLQFHTTSDMILLCQHAIGFDPRQEEDRERLDRAMTGALGANRSLWYLERLRSLNDERKEIGLEIHRLQQLVARGISSEAELNEFAMAQALLPQLPGKQEVVVNFFCVSVVHIRSLLQTAAESVCYEIPERDLTFLNEFRHLRNHFEHWYSRLPGKASEKAMMNKILTEEEYRVEGGLRTDAQNRYLVIELKKIKGVDGQPPQIEEVEHAVDVTDHGVNEVVRIFAETDAYVRAAAIRQVQEHFITRPENILSPKDLPSINFLKVGGGPKR